VQLRAPVRTARAAVLLGGAAVAAVGALALPLAAEVRVARPIRPLTDSWRHLPIHPRGATLLGLSFRPPQVDALGLDPRTSLQRLLDYPFQLIRLGAYWRRLEPSPGQFVPDELDWQINAAERAGKHILLSVGAVKTFGYPEFFVPPWRLPRPIREGILVHADDHTWLLQPALEFVTRIVERYRGSSAIVGWQIEHESIDPLGLEHSWRLGVDFVSTEIDAVRRADSAHRPILLNGFLPMSNLVALQQWWRTRDQGDSLGFAVTHADIVGLDVYPRHGLVSVGPLTTYLDGGRGTGPRRLRANLIERANAAGLRVMVSEGQAEPWETVVKPPDPRRGAMFSCTPEQMLATYNECMHWTELYAYLFWGAEYWLLREKGGDQSYLRAFERVVSEA
jgi:hypothetical protein